MYVRIASDIHLEFMSADHEFTIQPMEEDLETVLVLAGDIGIGIKALPWIKNLSTRFKAIIYICGNHEYYKNTIGVLEQNIRIELEHFNNIHFLAGESVTIGDVRFYGDTLWADAMSGCANEWDTRWIRASMNDFNLIKRLHKEKNEAIKFSPQDMSYFNKVAVKNLRRFLKEPFEGRSTVIVTHHAPSHRSVDAKFEDNELNCCFATNLDQLVADSGAKLWVHGHMHDGVDYFLGQTRVICNPLGYPGEIDPSYNAVKRIEV